MLAEPVQTRPSKTDETLRQVTSAEPPAGTVIDGTGAQVAHAQVVPDPSDGVVRSLALVVEQDGKLVPSIALAALRAMQGDTGPITIRPDGVQVGDRFVATEARHSLRLNWADGLTAGDDKRTVISAVDVVNGTIDPERLRARSSSSAPPSRRSATTSSPPSTSRAGSRE